MTTKIKVLDAVQPVTAKLEHITGAAKVIKFSVVLVATPQSFEIAEEVSESVDIELATTRLQSKVAEASTK